MRLWLVTYRPSRRETLVGTRQSQDKRNRSLKVCARYTLEPRSRDVLPCTAPPTLRLPPSLLHDQPFPLHGQVSMLIAPQYSRPKTRGSPKTCRQASQVHATCHPTSHTSCTGGILLCIDFIRTFRTFHCLSFRIRPSLSIPQLPLLS